MSTTIFFTYPTHSNQKEFTTYDDSEDEDEYNYSDNDNTYDSDIQVNQLNKLDRTKITGGKTGTVIPTTNKDYQAAVAYKKAKRLAIKAASASTTSAIVSSNTPTPTPQQKPTEDSSSSSDESKTKKLTKSEINSIISNEIENKKKERLPSSIEVYNRIIHDEMLKDKINDFIITYEDRFDGLLDSELLKFDSAIPFHRIRQIRHLNQVVWDRSDRFYDFSPLLSSS